MHFAEPFERESEIVDALERAIQMYRELCEDSAALYAPRLAALCRDAGDYMACDIDVDWEAAFGIRLDLALEQCVDGPEQRIPMGWAFGDAPEEFDFRRVRKALCLMRYSAAVYEGYAAKGQNDCWLETAHTLHCLSRLLTCLHGWIGETDDADMRNTRAGLLADSCEGYRRMLDALRRHCDYTRARHSGLPQRTADSRPKAGEGGGTPERELAALERRAYEQDPLADCYNFALKLGSEGLEREAARLQEELRLFLKECFPEADPELVLLNLYACACDRKDCGEALALLLEFDESKAPENAIGRDTLFDYHCMIARCCAEKRDYAAADAHFERANAAMRPMRAWERACFDERWAMCRQDLGDLTGAMDRLWNAMEDLLELKELPVKAWNRMCREYAALLERAGREPEAEAWLKGMLAEQ